MNALHVVPGTIINPIGINMKGLVNSVSLGSIASFLPHISTHFGNVGKKSDCSVCLKKEKKWKEWELIYKRYAEYWSPKSHKLFSSLIFFLPIFVVVAEFHLSFLLFLQSGSCLILEIFHSAITHKSKKNQKWQKSFPESVCLYAFYKVF